VKLLLGDIGLAERTECYVIEIYFCFVFLCFGDIHELIYITVVFILNPTGSENPVTGSITEHYTSIIKQQYSNHTIRKIYTQGTYIISIKYTFHHLLDF